VLNKENIIITDVLVPSKIVPGDTVGIVSPAGSLKGDKIESFHKGIKYLQDKGFRLKIGTHVLTEYGYLAGNDKQRVDDLNKMITDPEIKAIIATRGGYGSSRILSGIDYDAIKKHPKILVGYSDITCIQLALFMKTGLITFSGPMVAIEMGSGIHPKTENFFWDIITLSAPQKMIVSKEHNPIILYRDVSEGRLLGGCISLVNACIGTPYLPDMTDSILFLEDINEDVYRIDRFFSQLANTGILETINGLILGQFIGCQVDEKSNFTLVQVVEEYTKKLKIPTILNFPYGHGEIKYTLPIGCKVRLDTFKPCLEMLEPGVI
jgi:muramoyltetrapeptide carboxypeptidase